MIEMLGVLAIIGVLSAGGIAGYSAAMEAYRTNKTIQMYIDTVAVSMPMVKKQKTSGTVLNTKMMCDLNLLPSEICRTCQGEYYRGYFGEKIKPLISNYAWGDTEAVSRDDDPLIVQGPLIYLENYIESEIPVSACIKIMTSPAWSNMGTLAVVSDIGSISWYEKRELPLTILMAEQECKAEIESGDVQFDMIIIFEHSGIYVDD